MWWLVGFDCFTLNSRSLVPGVSFWVQYKHPVGFLTPVKVFWMHPAEAYLGSPPTPWHPEETSLHTFTQPSVIQQDERVVAMAARFLCPLIHFCCFQTPHTSSEGWRRNARKAPVSCWSPALPQAGSFLTLI